MSNLTKEEISSAVCAGIFKFIGVVILCTILVGLIITLVVNIETAQNQAKYRDYLQKEQERISVLEAKLKQEIYTLETNRIVTEGCNCPVLDWRYVKSYMYAAWPDQPDLISKVGLEPGASIGLVNHRNNELFAKYIREQASRDVNFEYQSDRYNLLVVENRKLKDSPQKTKIAQENRKLWEHYFRKTWEAQNNFRGVE